MINHNLRRFNNKDLIKIEDKINSTLSYYKEKFVDSNNHIVYKDVETNYFLENNSWNIDFFNNIEQFKKEITKYKFSNKNITFRLNNPSINKEIKFIFYNQLFLERWKLSGILNNKNSFIKRLSEFINEKYSSANSLTELDLKKATIEWVDWLEQNNVKTTMKQSSFSQLTGKEHFSNSAIANFLKFIVNTFNTLIDEKEEWDKNQWDVRNLVKYGVQYTHSSSSYLINFDKISNSMFRKDIKKYIRKRLTADNHFSWSSAQDYLKYIPPFINLISELEPTWNDLKNLERCHMEKYFEWLKIYTTKNSNKKITNPDLYIKRTLTVINKFLIDTQKYEYNIAPLKSISILIHSEDRPKAPKKPNSQIDYVPNLVLEQLFENINILHKEIIPIVYIMFKTGLRISDVLGLTQECLIKLNNEFWIETDIEKTYVKGHRIPIDDELANMLAVLIKAAQRNSNTDNNPHKYIFIRYNGIRKGKPYSSEWVQRTLNLFGIKNNIVDESGCIYHFKNHSFRHTYAIKMLNGGADILTVQELLAHASPEMTMRYAKLLDDTKRKVFDKVVKQGVFSFDESDKLKKENNGEIPIDILDMLYTNHKLNALDTPYGTCMQRKNGKCGFAKQPPCLTCNGGSPCKDLCVGAFEGDTVKYEILISSTKTMIENAKMYNRNEMVSENEELLELYEDIYTKISQGNLIYSRLDKLKRKGGINE